MADTHQITTATDACITPANDQAGQNSCLDLGEVPKAPPLAKDLLAVDGD